MTRVLLVDDSQSFRKLMVIILSQFPTVECISHAQNRLEARAAVCTLKPDIVILDLHMPGGSGLEVLRDIKKASPAPIVVMCTGDPDPACRKQCLDEGADFFMEKFTDLSQWDQLLAILL